MKQPTKNIFKFLIKLVSDFFTPKEVKEKNLKLIKLREAANKTCNKSLKVGVLSGGLKVTTPTMFGTFDIRGESKTYLLLKIFDERIRPTTGVRFNYDGQDVREVGKGEFNQMMIELDELWIEEKKISLGNESIVPRKLSGYEMAKIMQECEADQETYVIKELWDNEGSCFLYNMLEAL